MQFINIYNELLHANFNQLGHQSIDFLAIIFYLLQLLLFVDVVLSIE